MCKGFRDLGIPLAKEKIVGPITNITYLGIDINSSDLTLSVPQDKLEELLIILPTWEHKKTCTKQQLLSLIGKLSFICKVVRPGRTFLRRMIDLSMSVQKLHHHINLNKDAVDDIKWWCEFLPRWNRSSIIPESHEITSNDIKLFIDASNIGFGAIYDKSWIQGQWGVGTKDHSIDFKELFAIVASVMTWGTTWEGKRIVFITDNLPITQIWHIGTSRSKGIMFLVRKLHFLAAQWGFTISLKHILGVYNPIADALSRFQVQRFNNLAPEADHVATYLPETIIELLHNTQLPH